MPKMTQITPFLLCSDLDAEIAFFRDALGFTVGFVAKEPDYAFLRCENVAVRLLQTDADLHDPARQQMIYIDVDDIDGLYRELEPELSKLPEGRVRAPFNQPYNQREFHVIDEGPYLLMFGQGISSGQ